MSALADLRRGWRLRGDGVAVQFSAHAVERFVERVRPSMDEDHVREELSRLLATATVSRTPPEWLRREPGTQTPTAYLLLGDDGEIVLPLAARRDGSLVATTAVTSKLCEGQRRQTWNAIKAKRRAGKRARKVVQKRLEGRRPPAGPSAAEWEES